jgi:hypothetical protein
LEVFATSPQTEILNIMTWRAHCKPIIHAVIQEHGKPVLGDPMAREQLKMLKKALKYSLWTAAGILVMVLAGCTPY